MEECKREGIGQQEGPQRENTSELHVGVGSRAMSGRTGDDSLSQPRPVGKQRSRLSLHVVLLLCQVELGRHGAQLSICGRVEAVGSGRPCSEWGSSFTVTFFFDERCDLAVLSFALDDDERVNVLDRLAVVRRKAEHVVEHNGAVGKRFGCDEQALTQCALRERCEDFGKLGLDAVGTHDYVTRGKSEDGLVGKEREALIAGRDRGVELMKKLKKVSFVVLGLSLWKQLRVLGCETSGVESGAGCVEHT